MIVAVALLLGAITPLSALSDECLRELWRHSPMAASQAGYHQGDVDSRLDELSAGERARRSAWLHAFRARLVAAAALAGTAPEDAADGALLRDAVDLELLDLDEAHDFERRADTPLDALGSTFFQMVARPYAPDRKRIADLIARLAQVPRYLEQARGSLTARVEAFQDAARDDGKGLVEYLEHDLVSAFARSPTTAPLGAAALAAADAVRAHLAQLDRELAQKPERSFRYGAALYRKRFGVYLQTDRSPEEILAQAERRARELHGLIESAGAALAQSAADHATSATLLASVRQQLAEARRFVAEHRLLSLPPRENLRVIETPPFLRSQLGVAAFDGAPPLSPDEGAFYYVTPLPADWPPAKVAAKLREYNRMMLTLITIHEAMPGHYVQFEHAQAVRPETRRVLRWLLGSNAYVEGWAVYAQELMVEAGFLDHDPRLRLQQAKLELRAVVNAILDIQLQTRDLSDEQALELLMKTGFQERPEAELKLRRAKLSVTQLCSYFVGGEAWRALRREAEGRPGFQLRDFHDRALATGAVPLSQLRALLGR